MVGEGGWVYVAHVSKFRNVVRFVTEVSVLFAVVEFGGALLGLVEAAGVEVRLVVEWGELWLRKVHGGVLRLELIRLTLPRPPHFLDVRQVHIEAIRFRFLWVCKERRSAIACPLFDFLRGS